MRTATAKEAFNRKISHLTSKLNNELGKRFVRCYVRSIDLDTKQIGAEVFGTGGEWRR